jgi:hypothetical protein
MSNNCLLESYFMTHAQLVPKAVAWLRRYRCGVVLSEQACASGEMPDAIGWKKASHSVLVECKISRADFLVGELPAGWGLLECRDRKIEIIQHSAKNFRTAMGFDYEMNLLLASLRRVEIRIEPQTITDFLKWKNRMAEYNRGTMPEGIQPIEKEANFFLDTELEPVSGD